MRMMQVYISHQRSSQRHYCHHWLQVTVCELYQWRQYVNNVGDIPLFSAPLPLNLPRVWGSAVSVSYSPANAGAASRQTFLMHY